MLTFECPACKTKLQVDDAHAGKTIQCPSCKAKATAPTPAADGITADVPVAPVAAEPAPTAVTTPENAPRAKSGKRDRDDDDDRDEPRRSNGGSGAAVATGLGAGAIIGIVVGVVVLVGGCVLLMLVALLVPAVSKVREAAARTQSSNNLKQITLGMHSFHDANKRLPFNGTGPAVASDSRSGSWAFQLLPYVEQQHIYNQPEAGRTAGIATFMCPGRGRPANEVGGGPWSDYFYNNYLNDSQTPSKPNNPDVRRTMAGITDGTANTIFVGHGNIKTSQYASTANVDFCSNILKGGTTGTMRSGHDGQAAPGGVTFQRDADLPLTVGSWGGPFAQGGLMAMGDGSVRMVPYTIQNFSSFLTPTGGEEVRLPDF